MTDVQTTESSTGKARLGFLTVAGLLVLSTVALNMCAPKPMERAAAGAEATAVLVRTQKLTTQPLQRSTSLSGVVEPKRRVELFAEFGGRVTEVGAERLDRVEQDQVLVQMDPLLAKVAVERGLAAVARSESQLSLAENERKRFENLATRDAASASRRDQAVSAQKVAFANLREARANLDEARDQLAKKTVRAPFEGVLQAFPVEVGEYLKAGESLGELLDLSSARIELGVTDREIVDVAPGADVSVSLEAYPNEIFNGRILRVAAAADTTSRKFPVEIEVENQDQRILPGMMARVALQLGEPVPSRALPRDAVLDQFGVEYVFAIRKEGEGLVAERRRVEVRAIPFRPEQVEVVGGLEEGDEIAILGMAELRDGTRVRVRASPSSVADADSEAGDS